MHVARAWRLASVIVSQPLELYQVEYVHVGGRVGSLAKPAAYDVELVPDQGSGMSISALWRLTLRIDLSQPAVTLGIKYPKHTVVLLAVVAAEYIKLLLKQSRCVVLNLWRRLRLVLDRRNLLLTCCAASFNSVKE